MIFFKQSKKQKQLLRAAKPCAPYAYEPFLPYAQSLIEEAKPIIKRKLGLRLIVVADTHGVLAHDLRFGAFVRNVGEYDLCLLLGDVDYSDIEAVLKVIPAEKILAVRGNHDCMDFSEFGIRDLHRKAYMHKGVRFVGFEGAFKYKKGTFPCYTQAGSLRAAKKLPRRADVLVTHDAAMLGTAEDKAHPGLVGITRYLAENAVQWHLHGHVHRSYSAVHLNGTTEKSVYLWECIEI